MANVIARACSGPTLVLAHNKTLAAQLYGEFKELFPSNAVEYFVSYYDYYQPEAYIPSRDTYIEKDAIDQRRDRPAAALRPRTRCCTRRDVIIVASVSCIYGLGSPEAYVEMLPSLCRRASELGRDDAAARGWSTCQYERNDIDFHRGTFRVRGDIAGDLPRLRGGLRDPRRVLRRRGRAHHRVRPADAASMLRQSSRRIVDLSRPRHYVTPQDDAWSAPSQTIRDELARAARRAARPRASCSRRQRLEQRTRFDLEMLKEIGYCHGIENYSRHLSGRAPGEPPPTPARLLPRRLPAGHRREPPDDPAGARHVPRRPLAQGDAGRLRLPPALGARQPAADASPSSRARWSQAIYVSATPGDVRAASRPAAWWSSRSSGRPA